ncbi:MAG: putative amidohydrolase [Alteromonadaceae bacterium]|jgi:predicted amidohydrolase
MRVAVSQFATSSNIQENLATCLRMIDKTAICKPSLILLPEFCNTQFDNRQFDNTQRYHVQPTYIDHNQAWNEALAINGSFLQCIAEQAKQHGCYIVINITLRRDLTRNFSNDEQSGSIKSNISVTSCLFSPQGKLIHQEDKQTLTAAENIFFISASKVADIVTTPFGKLGLLTGSDSMRFNTSRGLALRGAQLLCNSINSFAIDQSCLHDPARAGENNVFLATANKVASLDLIEHISQETLLDAGQSQIIAPDGKVLAKIANDKEGFVFADIDLVEAGLNKKRRPDGTHFIKQLRPELYHDLTAQIRDQQSISKPALHEKVQANKIPETANVAIFATYKSNEEAIEDVCHYIENNVSDIIQLPELFFITDKNITKDAAQLAQITQLSKQLINQISAVLRPFQYVCTSVVLEGIHQAVLISEHGLFATQQQLHFCQRYQWTPLGDDLNIIELPLEQGNINLVMLTADDANIAEIVKVAALHDIHLLLVPFDIQEPYEVDYSLLSRAAENRICIVAASREKDFVDNLPNNDLPENNANKNIYSKNKRKVHKSTGLIINLTAEPSLLPRWKSPKFNGYINQPLVKSQHGKITKALVHPIAACNKPQ